MNAEPDAPRDARDEADAPEEAIRDQAAHWVVRQDRGLSPAESAEFERWQAADWRHRRAVHDAAADWATLDRIAPVVAVPAPPSRRWAAAASLAAAAALAFLLFRPMPELPSRDPPSRAEIRTLVAGSSVHAASLADGSQVLLNAGGVLLERFTAAERTVRLLRGEAHFAVVKDPARPFVVRAGQAQIRAVGTAFNVRLREEIVDVIVTEGRIRVATTPQPLAARSDGATEPVPGPEAALAPLELEAGQQAQVPVSGEVVSVVNRLGVGEIARALAWQEPLLNLGGSTLAEVAAQFERRTGHRLVVADPELARIRVGGFFKPDDVAGFVHLLEECFGVQSERGPNGETRLRRRD